MLYLLARTVGSKEPDLKEVSVSSLENANWTEKNLENVLSKRIDLVLRESQLMVIFQERQWQEEADILALDKTGVLYIFEIKRTKSDQSNLLQVLRYGQVFGQYLFHDLQDLFRKYTSNDGADLCELHRDYFMLPEALAPEAFNIEQKFVVVTAGIDLKTLEAVRYWRKKGLPIIPLTYHVYEMGKEFLLEFHSYAPQAEDYRGLLSEACIVNTNRTYDGNAYKAMLAQGKASAFGGRRTAVDGIAKHSRVFLYHNGVGVIAMGTVKDGKVHEVRSTGPEDEEHYMLLDMKYSAVPYQEPDKCVSPSEIRTSTGTNIVYRQTVFGIDKQMADAIQGLLEKKHNPVMP